jgi:hypothetical protein
VADALPVPRPAVPVIPRAEREILVCCARRRVEGACRDRLRAALTSSPDWGRLLRLAERHRLVPHLHRHLRSIDFPLPHDFSTELRARFGDGARRALMLAGELHAVLEALSSAGVRALAYKGPALAMDAYGDLAMRTLSDLDLLVPPAEIPRALDVLAARGYAPRYALTPARERAFRRVDGDYPLWREETATLLELHAHASSLRFGVRLDTGEMADSARPVRVGGADVPAPAPDDLLVALALHGAKHRWARLEWIAAFAEVARANPDALASALSRADRLRARRVLALALLVAREVVDLHLSEEAAAVVGTDGELAALAEEVEHVLFGAADEPEDTAANLRFNLRLREGVVERTRFAWRWLTLPTPEDWQALPLPDALFPLYRAVRPLRLLARYAPGVLRRGERGG